MITEIVMPKIGFSMEEGTIGHWLKKKGEAVKKGEPVLEIISDKANMEIEAPADGYLREILFAEGETAPVLQVIGYIGELDDSIPTGPSSAEAKEEPSGQDLGGEDSEQAPVTSGCSKESGRIKISPRARKYVEEKGISEEQLTMVLGSGFNGLIVEKDLYPLGEEVKTQTSKKTEGRSIEASAYRKAIAKRLTESSREVPQFFVGCDLEVTGLIALREKLNSKFPTEQRISITSILVKCVAGVLAEIPSFNVSWNNGEIIHHDEINIGVAMATERGLTVPVIKNANCKRLLQINQELKEVQEKAKAGRLGIEDLSGGTFTISNLGMYRVDQFRAMINPPEAGILAVSRILKKPVVVDDECTIKPMMWVNLTVDHRVLDGSEAAVFLQRLAELIETPELPLI